jgi:hypothetical protein
MSDEVGPRQGAADGVDAELVAKAREWARAIVTNTAHHLGRRFEADEWTTDVFVRRDGRWVCVLSHITPAAPA